jgi:thiol-disulfide isomerase/thioredoxin
MLRSILLIFSLVSVANAQTPYRVVMPREDGVPIVYNMTVSAEKNKPVWVIRNASEKLRVDSIRKTGDSLYVDMPFFDSRIAMSVSNDRSMRGYWYKGTTTADLVMPVEATPGISWRFQAIKGDAGADISGRYAVIFTRADGTQRRSVAEFKQVKNKLTGTFLNPSGDYRFLEGIVTGDSLMLSCFDGSHAYYFGAKIKTDGSIEKGIYCSGPKYKESWTAVKDPNAQVESSGAMMYLKEGEERLNFRFPDLDSNMVSINDDRYRNKVVVIQIMGSWCPNCMDETAFLSEYYKKNRQRGVEVIGLAYEYTSDFRKAEKTLRKFQQRHKVDYPFLNTGVITSDTLRTEKTLPQMTAIKAFPTTIFVGRDGKVKKVHPGFAGPGTGEHHEQFKKEFDSTIEELLKQVADSR